MFASTIVVLLLFLKCMWCFFFHVKVEITEFSDLKEYGLIQEESSGEMHQVLCQLVALKHWQDEFGI
jgi:hypothetical protein